MTEAVRLVIWDLDETFWQGTLTEGGIKEYSQRNHDIVVELANRGILSSICSKNDADAVLEILRDHGILPFFVFPSISWTAKGIRLAQIVDAAQLRPTTVMFIDDNPNNRAEAAAAIPGLQIESEEFIPHILADSRFKGKPDHDLSRLRQYRLLEQKRKDSEVAKGSNEAFLRSCNIQVYIESNVLGHLDRAIELINRTNQLNFTKLRLPDDQREARLELIRQLAAANSNAGLVRAVDKYGDYGFVGFFLSRAIDRAQPDTDSASSAVEMIHFCFSCRTLGMLIERWVYDHLKRPTIRTVGAVLTDLSDSVSVDWVQELMDPPGEGTSGLVVAPEIVVFGGCEAQAVGGYLNSFTRSLRSYGNYASNGLFSRVNSAFTAREICCRNRVEFEPESKVLGLDIGMEAVDIFEAVTPEAVFVFNLSYDAAIPNRIRHKRFGWCPVLEPRSDPGINFLEVSEDALERHLATHADSYSGDQREHLLSVFRHIQNNYELIPPPSSLEKEFALRYLIERVPSGSKIVICVNHHEYKTVKPEVKISRRDHVVEYMELVKRVVADYPYAGAASVSEVIRDSTDLMESDHYTREVYCRFAFRIAQLIADVQPRSTESTNKDELYKQQRERLAKVLAETQAKEFVRTCYECLLRRAPDPSSSYYVESLLRGALTPALVVKSISSSTEFGAKWLVAS